MKPAPFPEMSQLPPAWQPGQVNWKLFAVLFGGLLVFGKVVAMAGRGPVATPEFRMMGIVAVQIALFAAAFLYEKMVFLVLVMYLPFSQKFPGDFGFAVNITNVLLIIIVFGLFMRSARSHIPMRERTPINRPLLVFVALTIVSFVQATYYAEEEWTVFFIFLKRYMTPMIIYFVTMWQVKDRETARDTLVVMMVTVFMMAFLMTKDASTPTHFSWKRRVGGEASQANLLAAFMVYYMFLFAGVAWQNLSKPRYWLLFIPLWPCARTIMLTFSRGGYIGAGVAFVAFFFFSRNKLLFFLSLAIAVAVFFSPQTFFPGSVVERIESTRQEVSSGTDTHVVMEKSARSRLTYWKGGLRMIAANPFLGVGYEWAPMRLPEYIPLGRPRDIHNAYITMAAEMGLPTLFVYLYIVYQILKCTAFVYRHSPDPLFRGVAHGFLAGLMGFLVANVFGDRLSSQETISYFWIITAILMKGRDITLFSLERPGGAGRPMPK